MMVKLSRPLAVALAAGTLALVASCGQQQPQLASAPPRPAPAPRIAEAVPPRPQPPLGAAPNLTVPHAGTNGLRVSVNRGLTPAQTVWNLRSAMNVAALNCGEPLRGPITIAYRDFLRRFAKGLTAANRQADAEFRAQYGAGFVNRRETLMTEVYNHYALPPTLERFCTAVAAVNRDMALVKPAELDQFAARSLPSIEVVFDDFYREYDQYRSAAAAWDARYGGRISAAPAGSWPTASTGAANPR